MADVRHGRSVPLPKRWRRLRALKRAFWSRQRRSDKLALKRDAATQQSAFDVFRSELPDEYFNGIFDRSAGS
jgi:hypothetical protein